MDIRDLLSDHCLWMQSLYKSLLNVRIIFYFLQGLPVTDDGNSHNFFCALRLVIEGQVPGQQKLFPQSARTKCVKPLILGNNLLGEGLAKWNELFIFEVPRKVLHLFLRKKKNFSLM